MDRDHYERIVHLFARLGLGLWCLNASKHLRSTGRGRSNTGSARARQGSSREALRGSVDSSLSVTST